MTDSITATDLSEDYPGQRISAPGDSPAPAAATATPSTGRPRRPAKGKGKGKAAKAARPGRTPGAAKSGKPGKTRARLAQAKSGKPGKGKTPAPGGVDYAARAAKILAAREANRKGGLGSVRVQRAFAKAMRKAAGL